MERAAFLLVRLLSIFLGGWVLIQLAGTFSPFSLGFQDIPYRLIPYGVVLLGAVLLWFGAASIARKISLDAYRWLPLEDDETDEPWLRQVPISVESILAAALIVAGTVFAVRGAVALTSWTIEIIQPFDTGFGVEGLSVGERLQQVLGSVVGNSLLLGIGLFLMFGSNAIVAPVRRLRRWYALEPNDEEASGTTWEDR